ncbi:MAG: paraquat-inducible protein A [Desulfobacterales bacterium]
MTGNGSTARGLGYMNCRTCGLLVHVDTGDRAVCPRCGETVHWRKPNSISRTWALLIAAAILYVPANVLPVTRTTSLGVAQSDTIISGVIYFLKTGSWPIAMVIFVASVCVPVLKIFVLAFLMITVQRGSTWRPRERTVLYRITELVGRWSMVDVFVVTILVALVRLGALASVDAQIGVVFFAAVVVLTMFAAMTFDPRLIWDAMERQKNDR